MNARRLTSITLASLCALAGAFALSATPALAAGQATIAPTPTAGPPGLPDGRVYEQVSPANKNGNAAAPPVASQPPGMLAEPGGEGVAYTVVGAAIGNAQSGFQTFTVAKRATGGWVNNGAAPRSLGEQCALCDVPQQIGFSADLSQVFFISNAKYLPGVGLNPALLYNIASRSFVWLNPPPASTANEPILSLPEMAGFSSDMSTFYFGMQVVGGCGFGCGFRAGFFEWHDGAISVAGVLPDGTVDPAALQAGNLSEGREAMNDLRNQVSVDGTRAFFVSSLEGGGAPELYVRVRAESGSESTVLVSRDTLLGPVGGLPAPAPAGVLKIVFPSEELQGEALSSEPLPGRPGYVYASPDGSRVFFESTDALTSGAREAEEHGLPAGDVKEYMFDTKTATLTYLPGVADALPVKNRSGETDGVSPILVSSQDGSHFLFNGPGGLSLWSEAGSEGGTVTPVGPFAVGGEARTTPDGSVFVFESAAPIAGFNNGGSHFRADGRGPYRNQEIYRYDVAEGSLSCVSCPPAGIVPSGNAYFSHEQSNAANEFFVRGAGLSTDGSRVFFDTPDPLVPQDTNTAPLRRLHEESYEELGRDVYEWQNGQVFLISSGTSSRDSYVGDNSADGNDVFFSTAQGLSPGDTDEGYDVYDARVPRPGDRLPPSPAACAGDVCQGPPSVPVLLGAPASATFSGLGNATSGREPGPSATPAAKPKVKAAKCKKSFVRKRNRCVKKLKAKKAKAKKSNRRAQ